jgi:hypothetical protein
VRVHGSYKDVLGKAGALQSAQPVRVKPPELVLVSYPKPLHCAGTLTYRITTTGDAPRSTTTSMAIDPVYRFEWSVGYGLDLGKPSHVALADHQPAGGSTAEKVIVDPRERTGLAPMISLLLDVCGTNPHELDWCDRFVNPTLWLDPKRLDQGFGAGLTLRPCFSVGIVLGVSLFKSTELDDGVAAKPGDRWTAAGALPTKTVFNQRSLGLLLGVTVDSAILEALFN